VASPSPLLAPVTIANCPARPGMSTTCVQSLAGVTGYGGVLGDVSITDAGSSRWFRTRSPAASTRSGAIVTTFISPDSANLVGGRKHADHGRTLKATAAAVEGSKRCKRVRAVIYGAARARLVRTTVASPIRREQPPPARSRGGEPAPAAHERSFRASPSHHRTPDVAGQAPCRRRHSGDRCATRVGVLVHGDASPAADLVRAGLLLVGATQTPSADGACMRSHECACRSRERGVAC